jgi:hypothetical protein
MLSFEEGNKEEKEEELFSPLSSSGGNKCL